MTNQFTASIRAGFDEINVRLGPGTNYSIGFTGPTGLSDLRVLDVKPDDQSKDLNGKVYQWFRLEFPDGRVGWVRDDLINVSGDGTAFGYGVIAATSYAFDLRRTESNTSDERKKPRDAVSTLAEQERIIRAAFNVTSAFEGGSYAAYQTYDKGIISYGRFQFTLQSGSLSNVINLYLSTATSPTAEAIRQQYQTRLNARDISLQDDDELKALLQKAAHEPLMQKAQDSIAREQYWDVVYRLSIKPRGIKTPLTQALFFDIGVQHGTRHGLYSRAEEDLGVEPKSHVGTNGISEQHLVRRIAEIRQEILYRIAEQQDLPGVRDRADFWLKLIQHEDWQLQGDVNGDLLIFGRRVQVRNP